MMIFFLFIGFLRGRVLLSSCLCYNVCRGDGDLRMGGIRASVSYATPPYAGGVVRLLLLIFTASPLLLYPRRSSLLNRPAFLYDRRGDFFFCLLINYTIIACLPSPADVALIYPCGRLAFFGGSIWILDRLLTRPAVPSSVFPLTRFATHDVIVPIVSLIVSPYGFSSPIAPFFDTPGGEGCLLGLAVLFMSAHRGIIRPRYSSNRSSPRLLAPCLSIPWASPSIDRL